MLEPITKTIDVPCAQAEAFKIFTQEMGGWWPLDKRAMSMHHCNAPAKGLAVQAQLGGRIVETDAADNEHHWGTYTVFEPHGRVVMDFHMGLPPENASTVEVLFEDLGQGRTRVQLTQSNWEAFGDMAEMMRNGYGSGWVIIFEDRYCKACEAVAAE